MHMQESPESGTLTPGPRHGVQPTQYTSGGWAEQVGACEHGKIEAYADMVLVSPVDALFEMARRTSYHDHTVETVFGPASMVQMLYRLAVVVEDAKWQSHSTQPYLEASYMLEGMKTTHNPACGTRGRLGDRWTELPAEDLTWLTCEQAGGGKASRVSLGGADLLAVVASSLKVAGDQSIRAPADYGSSCKNEGDEAEEAPGLDGSHDSCPTCANVQQCPHDWSVGTEELEEKRKATGEEPTCAPEEQVKKTGVADPSAQGMTHLDAAESGSGGELVATKLYYNAGGSLDHADPKETSELSKNSPKDEA